MLRWIQDMKLEPLRQGVVFHSGGATVWVCVAGEDEVQKLQEHVVLVFEDRPPLIIRMRTNPPGSMEPMEASRPGGEGWTPETLQAEGAAEPMRFSEVTRKMVGQLRKTKGFTAMHGGGEVDRGLAPGAADRKAFGPITAEGAGRLQGDGSWRPRR